MKNYIIVAVIIVLIIIGVVWYTSKTSTEVTPATTEGTVVTDGSVAPAQVDVVEVPAPAVAPAAGTPVVPAPPVAPVQ
ncbi:MAG: hypothetical protein NTV48_02200 [Candidatus Vogelbacteria bacterium]|nr:hypothetical protein [Candidatus Vogelbacteria bacterium]